MTPVTYYKLILFLETYTKNVDIFVTTMMTKLHHPGRYYRQSGQ